MKSHFPSRKSLFAALGLVAANSFFSGCVEDSIAGRDENPPDDTASTLLRRVYVATSDYTSGLLLSFDADSLKRGPDSLEIHSDSRIVSHGEYLYVLERFGADNILKYDPVAGRVVYQKHLADMANPADIGFHDDSTAYVAMENTTTFLKVDPRTGTLRDSVDLSDYIFTPDSGQGEKAQSPHAFAVQVSGDTVFLGLQRRNGDYRFPGGASFILMLDANTLAVLDTLVAPGSNASVLWMDEDGIYLACQGALTDLTDGGIYRWDKTDWQATTLFSGEAIAGNITSVVCDTQARCYASVGKSWPNTQILSLDFKTRTVQDSLPGLKEAGGGLAWDAKTGRLWVGERNATQSGLVVFDAQREKVGATLKTGLPPADLHLARR